MFGHQLRTPVILSSDSPSSIENSRNQDLRLPVLCALIMLACMEARTIPGASRPAYLSVSFAYISVTSESDEQERC